MAFTLTGVTNQDNLRRFTFQSAGRGAPPIAVVVLADLALARKYDIPLQELPLLCLRFLEDGRAGGPSTLAFSETEMIEYAKRRSLAKDLAEQKKRVYRPPRVRRNDV